MNRNAGICDYVISFFMPEVKLILHICNFVLLSYGRKYAVRDCDDDSCYKCSVFCMNFGQ